MVPVPGSVRIVAPLGLPRVTRNVSVASFTALSMIVGVIFWGVYGSYAPSAPSAHS